MMRSHLLVGAALAVVVAAAGCVTTQPEASRYVASFDFAPAAEASPGSAGLTFAVVRPACVTSVPLFGTFSEKMGQDLFEVLAARGFNVRGPFATYDQLTYPDKKGSDLLLMPKLTVTLDTSRLTWKEQVSGGDIARALLGDGRKRYKAEGEAVLGGRINLVVAESLSRERMWVKSVDIAPVAVRVETTGDYYTIFDRNQTGVADGEAAMLLQREPNLYNDVARALEGQYRAVLQSVYNYLDPDEMQAVNRQAEEIRKRKVY